MPIAVDFARIREFNQSQNLGFEELCCQLAALEPEPAGSTFLRKGKGSDQGVECFRTHPDGTQVGWQAKYFLDMFEDDQVRQIEKSLQRALHAHATLRRYIVCLPIDLNDQRGSKKLSQVQRFEQWRSKTIEAAKAEGRALEIELWGASQLRERLTRDTPLYAGKLRYWFDIKRLTSGWFEARFEAAKSNLGIRYTPESHVELPTIRALQALARDDAFDDTTAEWSAALGKAALDIELYSPGEGWSDVAPPLRASLETLLRSLQQGDVGPDQVFPLAEWRKQVEVVSGLAVEASRSIYSSSDRRHSPGLQSLSSLHGTLDDIRQTLRREPWPLLNERRLLIVGPAGIGKSHLVADFGKKQLERGRPFLLLLTQTLVDADPWSQILQQLDASDCRVSEFLGALDAAAEARGCRAVFAVDALNERHGLQLWQDRLAGFVKSFEPFPHLSLALTLRSTYERHLPTQGLPRVVHRGFSQHAGAAAKAYLDARGIARATSPKLLSEFENPLFLRTCCDFLDTAGLTAIPKGLDGVSALFDFYFAAVSRKIESRFGLDQHECIPLDALKAFASESATPERAGSMPKREAMQLFKRFLPSFGREDRSLFGALLAEGVLSMDVVPSSERIAGSVESVRFTFERFSDHLIAKRLLDENLDMARPLESFQRTPLSNFVTEDAPWNHAGIVEALAIQLPERCDLEILDLVTFEPWATDGFVQTFWDSLLWRHQSRFTQRTVDWLIRLQDESERDMVFPAMISVATESENAFNAFELHRRLMPLSMPDRDATWSVFLATDNLSEDGAVSTLIDWARSVEAAEVDRSRRLLAGITLTWFFTTPNRAIRDRATKGLANLLSPDLAAATELLKLFKAVNDPYVVERLLGACYGAVLQGRNASSLAELSVQVWWQFFDGVQPPLDLVSRDYALGILEYVDRFAVLPETINLQAARGPFKSSWPLEAVTDEMMLAFREGGESAWRDSISMSTNKDGDFGSYSVRSRLHDWSNLPMAFAGMSTKDLFDAWRESYEGDATCEQIEAYITVIRAQVAYRESGHDYDWLDKGQSEKRRLVLDTFYEAEAKFRSALNPTQQADYDLRAREFLRESTRMGRPEVGHEGIDHEMVRRWVCWRAHDLGWTSELFGEFERSGVVFRDRMGSHRVERVGKKYQRIALAEAMARIADHLARDGGDGRIEAYAGSPSELWPHRDIDPSLMPESSKETGWSYTPRTWWVPVVPKLPSAPAPILLAWLDSQTDGFSSGAECIDVLNPDDGRRWFVLSRLAHWGIPGERRRAHPKAWSRVTCLLTAKGSSQKLAKEIVSRSRGEENPLFEDRDCSGFLGEHGWRWTPEAEPRLTTNESAGIKTPCMSVIARLLAEFNTKDNSLLGSVRLELPSAWLIRAMNLRLRNGHGSEYVDSDSVVRFFDPSLKERGAGAALVDREFFLKAMDELDLEPIWYIAGEKDVYAKERSSGFGGSVMYVTAYRVVNGELEAGETMFEKQGPSREQLKVLLEEDDDQQLAG